MINQTIAHYEITGKLGQGGMGEVYRATDTKLDRDVAIKILPESFAEDKNRVARFNREAKALAALNHPNIAVIHGIEQSDNLHALIMELIEGETLGERLARKRMTVTEALECCQQIAAALEAAHEKGIIHRDLKPDNVKLTPDGQVKVLDFGIAKALVERSGGAATTVTATVTKPGALLGTPAYMSPEQARGEPMDRRSDIWSFGCVLYELLTGERAFIGRDVTQTLAEVIKGEPDWSRLPTEVSPPLRRVLSRCVEKDPRHRWHDIADVRIAIETACGESADATAGTPPRSVGKGLVWLSWAASAVLAVALAVALWSHPDSPPKNRWTGQWLGGPDVAYGPSISPDGQMLAFSTIVDGLSQVGVMKPESGNYQVLTDDRTRGMVGGVTWSADSTKIYFYRHLGRPNGIYSVPVLGGEERLVWPDAQDPHVLPDGSLLIAQLNDERKRQLYRLWPETHRIEPLGALVAGPTSGSADVTPAGDRVVFYGTPLEEPDAPSHVYAMELDSGQVTKVAPNITMEGPSDGLGLAILPDGASVVFGLQAGDAGRFVRASLDGAPDVETLMTLTSLAWGLSTVSDGWLYTSLVDRTGEVLRLSPSSGVSEHIVLQPFFETAAGLPVQALVLPDGRTVFSAQQSGRLRLTVTGPGKEPAPFVETRDQTAPPVVMVGQTQAAFMIGEGDNLTIGIASISDGRVVRRLNGPRGVNINSLAIDPDNETIYYTASGSVWSVPVSDGAPTRLGLGDSVTVDPYKRDLIVILREREAGRLLRVPLGGGPEQDVPIESGFGPTGWDLHPNAVGPDGRILLTVGSPSDWFWRAAVLNPETGRVEILDVGFDADMSSPGWTPDGDIIVTVFPFRSSLWRFRAEQVGD